MTLARLFNGGRPGQARERGASLVHFSRLHGRGRFCRPATSHSPGSSCNSIIDHGGSSSVRQEERKLWEMKALPWSQTMRAMLRASAQPGRIGSGVRVRASGREAPAERVVGRRTAGAGEARVPPHQLLATWRCCLLPLRAVIPVRMHVRKDQPGAAERQIPEVRLIRVRNLPESEPQVQIAGFLKIPDPQPHLELFRAPHVPFVSLVTWSDLHSAQLSASVTPPAESGATAA
jgi:hypothetical protein